MILMGIARIDNDRNAYRCIMTNGILVAVRFVNK